MDNNFKAPHDLSDIQTQTLLLAFTSPSPSVALSTVQSNEKTTAAASVLTQLGLLRIDSNGAHVTDDGIAMLDAINVVDKNGERTPYGEEEFAKAVELTAKNTEQFESAWPLLSSISQHV